jgi:hypothetical protein
MATTFKIDFSQFTNTANIQNIKMIREKTHCGLRNAKEFFENFVLDVENKNALYKADDVKNHFPDESLSKFLASDLIILSSGNNLADELSKSLTDFAFKGDLVSVELALNLLKRIQGI